MSYLPQNEGILQYWLLLLSIVSIGNSVQSYLTTSYTRRIYSAPDTTVTPLHARTFGTYTALASIIRLYAAYNITDPVVYQLALWTYVVALGHFYSEWLVFRTARFGEGLVGPLAISMGSIVWMVVQWGEYIR
ncbi:MAG: hypothetical protein LQ350_000895 [Teloschistes chrysophthalmus]|nr:MAG: hypothetical protein LQ350_000895 [Niorma chrysophthalma]